MGPNYSLYCIFKFTTSLWDVQRLPALGSSVAEFATFVYGTIAKSICIQGFRSRVGTTMTTNRRGSFSVLLPGKSLRVC